MGEYFFGITDKGRRREKNEDTFIAEALYNKELLVACVIDGVGGYCGGDIAAGIARSVILEHLGSLPGNTIEILQAAIIAANTKIREEKKKDARYEQMACVLTCAVTDIKNNKLYYAHIGDTRLYLLRDRSLIKLTKDHSVVGFLEESGRLSEEDAMRHPRRNEINKALGFEENITADFIETGESPFLPGDTILICSDGLSDMIASNTITSILLSDDGLADKASALVNAANDAGGNDNITAVVVQNNNKPIEKVISKPAERKNKDAKSKLRAIKDTDEAKSTRPNKRKEGILAFLTLLTFCTLVILLFQKNTSIKENNVHPKYILKPKEKFIFNINDSLRRYTLHAPIIKLDSAILVNKDSFHLVGNGTTITCDSNYKGPAISIDRIAKHIVLDSLIFKNFDVAVIIQKNNVVLKNVRFINCRVPVQYALSFRDTVISGRFKDSIFIPVSKLK
ncbi:MAG: protein phosphatase 2C domain-containing protein [Ferruginibacter sp.]